MKRTLFVDKYPALASRCLDGDKLASLSYGSDLRLRWQCERGGHYFTAPVRRVPFLKDCPVCTGVQICPGFNDLATKRPDLIAFWSSLNTMGPADVSPGMRSVALWSCPECRTDFEMKIYQRAERTSPLCKRCLYLNGSINADFIEFFGSDLAPGAIAASVPEIAGQYSSDNALPLEDVAHWSTKVLWSCSTCESTYSSTLSQKVKTKAGCPFCSGLRVRAGLNDVLSSFPDLVHEWDSARNTTGLADLTPGSAKRVWWKCTKGHSWDTFMYARIRNGVVTPCPRCSLGTNNGSTGQSEIHELVSRYACTESNFRGLGNNLEVDVYLPELKLGIEYNGLYWHSDALRESGYHKRKQDAADQAGVRLITVWEDDWQLRRDVVEKMLLHKVGVSREQKLNARSMQVRQVEALAAARFYDLNHIQGSGPHGITYGLFAPAKGIVAAMSFRRRSGGSWELTRYATSCIVRGGFSKLLRAFEREHSPSELVSFSDRMVSDGGLYRTNGFSESGQTKPTYMYVVNKKRVHKANYRVERFRRDPGLLFEEGKTESELAALNGLMRVFDAGKVRWVKNYRRD